MISFTDQQLDMLAGLLFGLGFGIIIGYYLIWENSFQDVLNVTLAFGVVRAVVILLKDVSIT